MPVRRSGSAIETAIKTGGPLKLNADLSRCFHHLGYHLDNLNGQTPGDNHHTTACRPLYVSAMPVNTAIGLAAHGHVTDFLYTVQVCSGREVFTTICNRIEKDHHLLAEEEALGPVGPHQAEHFMKKLLHDGKKHFFYNLDFIDTGIQE